MSFMGKPRAVLIAIAAILLCGCATARADVSAFFDPGIVHRIGITLSEEDWGELLAHPADKVKYKADLVIDASHLQIRDMGIIEE